MKTCKLGKLDVSEFGFGNITLSGSLYGTGFDRAKGLSMIRDAYERVVTFFDTKGVFFLAKTLTLALMFLTSTAFSQRVIDVWSSKNLIEIKKQAELFLDQLDVQENIHLTIMVSKELPETLQGITVSIPSHIPSIFQFIKVWIDASLSTEKQLIVLAHEMIHVKQYVKKELTVDERSVIWKGREFNRSEYNSKTPWEIEAYGLDQTLAKVVADIPLEHATCIPKVGTGNLFESICLQYR